jgi:hypothetical protein
MRLIDDNALERFGQQLSNRLIKKADVDTKVEELNDKLDGHTHSAKDMSFIGDMTLLETGSKDTLVNAINEIQREAGGVSNAIENYEQIINNFNNDKRLIASVVGTPLNANDELAEMANDINGLLATFKTNMMNSGVEVNSGDKFKALIDKIKGLTEGEGNNGIQYNTGVYNHIYAGSNIEFDITGIGFKPVILQLCRTNNDGYFFWIKTSNMNDNRCVSFSVEKKDLNSSSFVTPGNYGIDNNTIILNDDGFSFKDYLGGTAGDNWEFEWIAIGEGKNNEQPKVQYAEGFTNLGTIHTSPGVYTINYDPGFVPSQVFLQIPSVYSSSNAPIHNIFIDSSSTFTLNPDIYSSSSQEFVGQIVNMTETSFDINITKGSSGVFFGGNCKWFAIKAPELNFTFDELIIFSSEDINNLNISNTTVTEDTRNDGVCSVIVPGEGSSKNIRIYGGGTTKLNSSSGYNYYGAGVGTIVTNDSFDISEFNNFTVTVSWPSEANLDPELDIVLLDENNNTVLTKTYVKSNGTTLVIDVSELTGKHKIKFVGDIRGAATTGNFAAGYIYIYSAIFSK